jgi:hypothetical protein
MPCGYASPQAFRQRLLVRTIGHPQALARPDRKPWLPLMPPRAMHGWQDPHQPRMFGQPGLHVFARMHPSMIEPHMPPGDGRGHLPLHRLPAGEACRLSWPRGCRGVALPRARSTTGTQVQGALTGIRVCNPPGLPRLGSQRGGVACPGLQTGVLVHAQAPVPDAQWTGIPGHKRLHLRRARRLPWHRGRQPPRVAPGLERVVGPKPLDRLRRPLLAHAVMDQLAGPCDALPWRQGPPDHVRTLASPCDLLQRHRRGKNRPPAGSFLVTQTIEPMGDKAQGPRADMALAPLHLPRRGGPGGAVGHEPHGPRPLGEPSRGLLLPEPPRQGGPCGVRHLNRDGRVASLPIFTPSRCQASVMKHQPPQCQFFRPFSMGTCTKRHPTGGDRAGRH